jgi:hypothetical protein
MMKIGNIDSTIEAANFLINKVRQPYIGDYVNRIPSQPGHPKNFRDTIVPDLHATNYLTGSQIVNDSGASRSAGQSSKSKLSQYVRHDTIMTID